MPLVNAFRVSGYGVSIDGVYTKNSFINLTFIFFFTQSSNFYTLWYTHLTDENINSLNNYQLKSINGNNYSGMDSLFISQNKVICIYSINSILYLTLLHAIDDLFKFYEEEVTYTYDVGKYPQFIENINTNELLIFFHDELNNIRYSPLNINDLSLFQSKNALLLNNNEYRLKNTNILLKNYIDINKEYKSLENLSDRFGG